MVLLRQKVYDSDESCCRKHHHGVPWNSDVYMKIAVGKISQWTLPPRNSVCGVCLEGIKFAQVRIWFTYLALDWRSRLWPE